jgi:hypothetical protein
MEELSQRRYEALAGYTRSPNLVLIVEEISGLRTPDERVLGVVTHDLIDDDFGWVVLARDELLRFRCVDVNASFPTYEAAKSALTTSMERLSVMPDSAFYQGDTKGQPFDFFTPILPEEKQHRLFKVLLNERRYSCASELMASMMRYYTDIDGHFVREFQSRNFEARLWEIYLFATFTELRYATDGTHHAPDFVWTSPFGAMAMEATTINPPDKDARLPPTEPSEYIHYLQNYVPIRYARALKAKVEHRPPYWTMAHTKGLPFVLALQDFHAPRSMMNISIVMTEYLFGVRHRMENGQIMVERMTEHRIGTAVEPSGFFFQPGTEHVSAVIANPQGTITKFNRMGYLAEFGDRRIKMIREGLRRSEPDGGSKPIKFVQHVDDPDYEESWVEGMVVWHNPNAHTPLDPSLIPGAAHEMLLPNGRIQSLLPDFHPINSVTSIVLKE